VRIGPGRRQAGTPNDESAAASPLRVSLPWSAAPVTHEVQMVRPEGAVAGERGTGLRMATDGANR